MLCVEKKKRSIRTKAFKYLLRGSFATMLVLSVVAAIDQGAEKKGGAEAKRVSMESQVSTASSFVS